MKTVDTLNNLLFWNIDIVKCYKKVYNNIKKTHKLPKVVRLVSRASDVIDDTKIIQEWMVIGNNRMREENILKTAREDGLKEGYNKGLELGIKEGTRQRIEQGTIQGLEKGIKQGTNQGKKEKELEIIKNMLNKSIDYNIISEVVNKSIDEIKDIELSMIGDK